MNPTPTYPRRKLLGWLLAAGAVFALAYTQSPFGFSNQNQYFLHGVAQSGNSALDADWLANTKDPTPLFSWYLSQFVRSLFGPQLVWLSYFVLLVLYVFSLAALLAKLPQSPKTAAGWVATFALIVVSHAAVWRWLSVKTLGVDYPWYFQAGFASQYILGAGFQPSVFGVFLVASLAAFVWERRLLAVGCAVVACVMHFTYLLPTLILAAGCCVALGRSRASAKLALSFAVGLSPVVAFNAIRFAPTDAATFAEAQRLLVEVRIPHHALVSRWLDLIAGLQIAWVLLACWCVRRTSLGIILIVGSLIAAVLTLIAAFANWYLLNLLFPWRISAVLVPIATAIFAARVGSQIEQFAPRIGLGVGAVLILASLLGGLVQMTVGYGYATNDAAESNLHEQVNRRGRKGNVYLIPTKIPPLNSGKRGAASTTFTPPPRPSPNSNLIPVDLQRFRLMAGRPIYVDFKSIPYADYEVLEWYRRLKLAHAWYEKPSWGSPETRAALKAEGITHVVVPATTLINSSPSWSLELNCGDFDVYRLE